MQFLQNTISFFTAGFPQENVFISVDNVDKSVYKSIFRTFTLYFLWICCERMKK